MLGLSSDHVSLSPYTADWPRIYLEEQARLQDCIGAYVLDIQHVGSTSIPGIAAKPILDIAIGVAEFEQAARCVELIEPLPQLGLDAGLAVDAPRALQVLGATLLHHLDPGARGLGQAGQRFFAAGGLLDVEPLPFEDHPHRAPDVFFVVDDEDRGGHGRLEP